MGENRIERGGFAALLDAVFAVSFDGDAAK